MKSATYVSYAPSFSHPIAAAAWSIISAFVGQVIVIYFVKRTTGETRRMVCYHADPIVTRRPWNPAEKNLLNVFDIEAGAPRFVSMDAVQKIVAGGSTYFPSAGRRVPVGPEDPTPAEVMELLFA